MYSLVSTGVPADQLLSSMARVSKALAGDGVQIEIDAQPDEIPNEAAFPVALIVNELLSNAVKYGAPNGGRIRASIRREGGELELCVRDWGPGMIAPGRDRTSSGLGLVRGLCRQIGGKLEIVSEGGTSARIRFPVEA